MKDMLVFDVESIGLHGEGYAVGGVLIINGKEVDSFLFASDPATARGSGANRQWVADNVPPIKATHDMPSDVRTALWAYWTAKKEEYPDLSLAADVSWPVESGFLSACVADNPEKREWEGPYPLMDISSVMMARPVPSAIDTQRRPDELPKHCPLADSRRSARILLAALERGAL